MTVTTNGKGLGLVSCWSEPMAIYAAVGAIDSATDILKNVEKVQVLASAKLLENLRQMVNEPAFSDVYFVCKDGNEVHASRLLLAGRSDVLKSMLMNDMAESKLTKIAMPAITAPVLLSVFEFLYTGTLSMYEPQSWSMACELVSASRFFLLPDLDMLTRKFMYTQTSVVTGDLAMAAMLLSEALDFDTLCDDTDVTLMELVKILSSNWSEDDFVRSLTENAFHYLLKNSKSNCKDDDRVTFREYLRFRQVIRWWVYHSSDSDLPSTEEFVNRISPDEERALIICGKPEDFLSFETPPKDDGPMSNAWTSLQSHEGQKNAAIRLLTNIDCSWIHPVLVTKVVEPLKLVSAEQILSGFRYHALRRPMIFRRLEHVWEHGLLYSTLEQGYTIQKCRSGIGFAVMMAVMSRTYGVYQWRFSIQEHNYKFCELGLIYQESGLLPERYKFDVEKLSDQPCARVLRFEGTDTTINWATARGPKLFTNLKSNSRNSVALFTFNATEHTCSLCIQGQDHGVIWENLPSATYYPAVSLGMTGLIHSGRVRVELVSGFDIL